MDTEYEITADFLNKIDILSYIKKQGANCTLDSLMLELENTYAAADDEINNGFFEGCLFNWMNHEEFEYYLKERYGRTLKMREETTVYLTTS